MMKMRVYEFMLILETEPDQDRINRLYGFFGKNGSAPKNVVDFTLVVKSGKPIVDCTVEASSFEAALEMVLPKLRDENLQVVRVEVDEVGLAVLQEAIWNAEYRDNRWQTNGWPRSKRGLVLQAGRSNV